MEMGSSAFQYGITDVPKAVDTIDRNNDTLQVSGYIRGLEEFILHCPTPMSIALQGDWGTGKTTFLETIEKDFHDERYSSKVKTVYFNTWQFSQFNMDDRLYSSFLSSIIDRLGVKTNAGKELVNTVLNIAKSAGKAFIDAKSKEVIGTSVTDKVAVEQTPAEVTQLKAVQKLKDQYAEVVREQVIGMGGDIDSMNPADRPRLVILVDDLDRLAPERAVSLLETLKLFMDVENCVYVLAIDYDVVVNGVKAKYGNAMTDEKCRSFFDKIIQLPFSMPVSQYEIGNMLKHILGNDLGQYHTVISNMISSTLGTNPRTFKRLVNSYRLLETVQSVQNTGGSSERSDLEHTLLLMCLITQMYSRKGYDQLVRCRTAQAIEGLLGTGTEDNSGDETAAEENRRSDAGPEEQAENDRAVAAIASLGTAYQEVQSIYKGQDLSDKLLREMQVSSITNVVSSQEKASHSGGITVVIGQEQMEADSAADALGKITAALMNQYPDRIPDLLEKEKAWISKDGTKRASYWRAPREINVTLNGEPLYIGTSTGIPQKVAQARSLCRQLKLVPGKDVQWFQGGTELLKKN